MAPTCTGRDRRVLEYLSGIRRGLPPTVSPTLGPDATGLGWVYQYALEDTTGRHESRRAAQPAGLVSPLCAHAVDGVSEVAPRRRVREAVPDRPRPAQLLAYGIPVDPRDERDPERERRRRRDGDRALRARVHGPRPRLPEIAFRHRERRGRRDAGRHTDSSRRAGAGQRWPGGAARRRRAGWTGRRRGRHRHHALRRERAGDDPERQGKAGRDVARPAAGGHRAAGVRPERADRRRDRQPPLEAASRRASSSRWSASFSCSTPARRWWRSSRCRSGILHRVHRHAMGSASVPTSCRSAVSRSPSAR